MSEPIITFNNRTLDLNEQEFEMAETKTKIRSLPWTADPSESMVGDSDCWEINSEDGSICEITTPYDEAEATAEFIVRAVNNHDALVSALEVLRSTLAPVLRDYEVRSNADRIEGYVLVAVNQIDAALAAAKEQSR